LNLFAAVLSPFRGQGLARAFQHRDFSVFITGHWVSAVGLWVQRVAVGWLTWELTHSGAWLGGVALAQALPSMLFLPLSSTIVDRVDRLRLLRITQLASFSISGGLAVLVFADLMTIHLLLAAVLLFGVVAAFSMPAGQTVVPNLVPKKDLSAAIAVGTFAFSSSTFIGPAIAGLLIVKAGIGWAFVFNAFSFLVQYAAIRLIRNFRHEHRSGNKKSILDDMFDGLRYTAKHGGIMPLLILSVTLSFLARPLQDLLPGFADVIFKTGPEGLATLFAAFGIGGLAGALWIANRNRTEGITAIFLYGSILAAALTIVVALTRSFQVAVVAMAFLGMIMSAASNAAQIGIQNIVAGEMRGRVMGLYTLNYRAAPALGAMLMGGLSTLFGLQVPVATGGALCLIAFVIALTRRRAIAASIEAFAVDIDVSPDAASPTRRTPG